MSGSTVLNDISALREQYPDRLDLIDRYPFAMTCAAEGAGLPELGETYQTRTIDLYLASADVGDINPTVSVKGEHIGEFALDLVPEKAVVTMLDIDGDWAYVQIGEVVILDRLGGVTLPDVLVNPELIACALKDQL